MNPPPVKLTLEDEIIEVNQDKLALGFVPAGKELNFCYLHGLRKMVPALRGKERPFCWATQGINLLGRKS